MDPIYSDLIREGKNTESQLLASEKELESQLHDLEKVIPQTGQIKYAQKRVDETRARVEKLRQMALYWKLRAESRLAWDQEQYSIAFREKKPWPPPGEYADYKAQMALEMAPKTWSAQRRIESAKRSINTKIRTNEKEP